MKRRREKGSDCGGENRELNKGDRDNFGRSIIWVNTLTKIQFEKCCLCYGMGS